MNLLLARKLLKPIPRSSMNTKAKSTTGKSSTAISSRGSTTSVPKKLSTTPASSAVSSGTATVISDDEYDSDIEFGDIHPTPNYQHILQQRANLSSSPASEGHSFLRNAMGKVQRARLLTDAMSSPPPTSSPSTGSSDEVERHLVCKADSQILPQIIVTVYVFTKV